MREVRVCHLDEGGQLVSAAPAALVGVALEERRPPSEPVAFHGRPGKLSAWWCATTGGHVVCGSLRRRRVALELDFDPEIAWIGGEPVELHWQGARGRRRWRPDFVVRTVTGARQVVLVKPEKDGPQWGEDLEVARQVAAAASWQVSVRRVPEGVRLDNLELAADYRQPMRVPASEREAVEDAFRRERRPIGEGARASGVPYAAALDLAYRLVWQRRLDIHWDRPLIPRATAWLAEGAA
ncbi:TnsA-like heteromeric transposase endonuclease subunit [Streptomyces sp. PSKA30]|uniref:TnsA-like heteromeric transposase endonuclease subunit n=1 Tax=Streptomyces sp. PSKA30 TaxID=2874597 RepID=UPI001CD0FF48|nr:TnsA-like heteromeric transposase endonuclease subunit [Streptomyces sp. PSKA30]MBZ9645066.1 TnsA-like heteromeric transposase endonuclease subunit [Streptomyces sp. PSKA30]